MIERTLLLAALLLGSCYSSTVEEPADGGPPIDLDGEVPSDGGPTLPRDSGAPTPRDTGTPAPTGCVPETDPDVEYQCMRLLGTADLATAGDPRIDGFTWSYRAPCADGEPTWLDLELELSDPDHCVDELMVCGILMGGGTGWFDARQPACQIAQVGGDSLNLVVGDPDHNASRVGAVVYGCRSGSEP